MNEMEGMVCLAAFAGLVLFLVLSGALLWYEDNKYICPTLFDFLKKHANKELRQRVVTYTDRLEAAVAKRYPLRPRCQIDDGKLRSLLKEVTGVDKIEVIYISCVDRHDECPEIGDALGTVIYYRWAFFRAKEIASVSIIKKSFKRRAERYSPEGLDCFIGTLVRHYTDWEVSLAGSALNINPQYRRHLSQTITNPPTVIHHMPLSYWIAFGVAESHSHALLFESLCYLLLDCIPIGNVKGDKHKWVVLCG